MVRHEQLEQGVAHVQDVVGGGLHLHSGFYLANARGSVDALADVDYADAANAHRTLILLVAQGRDADPVHACGIEDGGIGGHDDAAVVDGQLNRRGLDEYCCRRRIVLFVTHDGCGRKQTPAGQRFSFRCWSTISGKCLRTVIKGA